MKNVLRATEDLLKTPQQLEEEKKANNNLNSYYVCVSYFLHNFNFSIFV